MAEPRRIAVITSTRADYGLLRWTIERLGQEPRVKMQLVVTGTHLVADFGNTVAEIRRDGFPIAAEVAIHEEGGDGLAAAHSAGRALAGLAESFRDLRPDLVLLLGDRFEILAAAQAAHLCRIPIAHLHGGEITSGSFDDGMRHAITKLSRLHLVSNEEHRQRVLQMGEESQWVHVVGAPGIENIIRLKADTRAEFEQRIGIACGSPMILLTYHPATAVDEDPERTTLAILDAVRTVPGASVIATGSNADPGARKIATCLKAAERESDGRFVYRESLGAEGYVSALRNCDLVLGNSSSGLIEAPSAGIPTVNVGERQKGRIRSGSVIDCGTDASEIAGAISSALREESRSAARHGLNPYAPRNLDISGEIVSRLLEPSLESLRAPKQFVDLWAKQ